MKFGRVVAIIRFCQHAKHFTAQLDTQVPFSQNFYFEIRMDRGNNSYERRMYESIDGYLVNCRQKSFAL